MKDNERFSSSVLPREAVISPDTSKYPTLQRYLIYSGTKDSNLKIVPKEASVNNISVKSVVEPPKNDGQLGSSLPSFFNITERNGKISNYSFQLPGVVRKGDNEYIELLLDRMNFVDVFQVEQLIELYTPVCSFYHNGKLKLSSAGTSILQLDKKMVLSIQDDPPEQLTCSSQSLQLNFDSGVLAERAKWALSGHSLKVGLELSTHLAELDDIIFHQIHSEGVDFDFLRLLVRPYVGLVRV